MSVMRMMMMSFIVNTEYAPGIKAKKILYIGRSYAKEFYKKGVLY